MKTYVVEKRVTVLYTYVIEAETKSEAYRIAEDSGEVHADEVAQVSESWRAHVQSEDAPGARQARLNQLDYR